MDQIVPFLGTLPGWALSVVVIIILLNYLAQGKIGVFVARWFERKLRLQYKHYDAVYTMLRESIEERGREQHELEEMIRRLRQILVEGQASLAVRQSDISQRISSHNLHFTGQHDQLNDILKKQEILTAVMSEKFEAIITLIMQIERRMK